MRRYEIPGDKGREASGKIFEGEKLYFLSRKMNMREKSSAVQELIRPVHRFRVFPDRDYDLSLAEMAVLHTSPMQRLRKLRQIGLGRSWTLECQMHSKVCPNLDRIPSMLLVLDC